MECFKDLKMTFQQDRVSKDWQANVEQKVSEPYPSTELFMAFVKMGYLPYIKPYRAKTFRDQPDYLYYDEKEWRYIAPCDETDDCETILFGSKSTDELAVLNESLKRYRLSFTVQDIKYILLKEDNEIEPFKEGLLTIHQQTGKYSPELIDVMVSKVLTLKQIEEDF